MKRRLHWYVLTCIDSPEPWKVYSTRHEAVANRDEGQDIFPCTIVYDDGRKPARRVRRPRS